MQTRRFQDFPSEIHLTIFGFLPLRSRRLNRVVCRAWQELLDDKSMLAGCENLTELEKLVGNFKEFPWLKELFLNGNINKKQASEVYDLLSLLYKERTLEMMVKIGIISDEEYRYFENQSEEKLLSLRENLLNTHVIQALVEEHISFDQLLVIPYIAEHENAMKAFLERHFTQEQWNQISVKFAEVLFSNEGYALITKGYLTSADVLEMSYENFSALIKSSEVMDGFRRGIVTRQDLQNLPANTIMGKTGRKFFSLGARVTISSALLISIILNLYGMPLTMAIIIFCAIAMITLPLSPDLGRLIVLHIFDKKINLPDHHQQNDQALTPTQSMQRKLLASSSETDSSESDFSTSDYEERILESEAEEEEDNIEEIAKDADTPLRYGR